MNLYTHQLPIPILSKIASKYIPPYNLNHSVSDSFPLSITILRATFTVFLVISTSFSSTHTAPLLIIYRNFSPFFVVNVYLQNNCVVFHTASSNPWFTIKIYCFNSTTALFRCRYRRHLSAYALVSFALYIVLVVKVHRTVSYSIRAFTCFRNCLHCILYICIIFTLVRSLSLVEGYFEKMIWSDCSPTKMQLFFSSFQRF